MSRKYRRTAVLLITCLCVSLFSETIYAQDAGTAVSENRKEQGDKDTSKDFESGNDPAGIVQQSKTEGESSAPVSDVSDAEKGTSDAKDVQDVKDEPLDTENPADETALEPLSAEDDDPGQGRLRGDVPSEFYDKEGGIQTMATGIKHNSKFAGYDIIEGIDVSKWNKTINWASVKKAGIDFAFVRTSYRGYEKGGLASDNYAASNLKNAVAAGVKVGAYIFSQAITVKEAQEEADYLLDSVKGYEITMPLVFDFEYYSGGRLDKGKLSKRAQTNICLAFCERIEAAGYTPLVYANKSMLTSDLYASEISSKYPVWLANYTTATSYAGDYTFWQYTDKGSVPGISGNVDMNVWYVKPGDSQDFDTPEDGSSTTTVEAPSAPVLSGKATSYDKVKLTWKKVSGATGYAVYRYNSEKGTYERIKTITNADKVTYTDTGRNMGTAYQYRVRAYNKPGDKAAYSGDSNTVTVTTDSTMTGKVNGTNVAVRKGPATTTAKLTTLAINTGVTITGTSGSWYQISLKIGGKDQTGYISKSYVTIIRKPTLSVTATSASKIKLKWDQISGADGYEIQRYNAAKGKYEKIKTIKKGTTVSYTNSGLSKKTTYKYRMRSYKTVKGKKIYSYYCSGKSATTK